jgi:ribosomal protein S18 acetylase RimI-like enzyme
MIRHAQTTDIPRIMELLRQVNLVHYEGRPDIFKLGTKYTPDELEEILADENRPILVYTDDNHEVQGYAFCLYQQHVGSNLMTDIKTLYIDDLCVDENQRGKHVGTALYDAVVSMAKENGCYNLTLNVWSCNPSALAFYQARGLLPQKIGMEMILE